MFKPALLAALLAATSFGASAQTSCNVIGSTTFCNGPNGSSTSQRIGDTTFINRSDGSSATLNNIGSTTFINDSRPGMSGNANRVGSTTFINQGVGTTTVQPIGQSTFITPPSGQPKSCNRIGTTLFCN